MKDYAAFAAALGIIDCAILKRINHNEFEIIYSKDDWLRLLLPASIKKKTLTISDTSPFLFDFLVDAEHFWDNNTDGKIHSGIWSEQCIDKKKTHHMLRLEATAALAGGDKFLVVTNMHHEFERQQGTLQAARELLISHDKMQAQHDYLNERLTSLLERNANLLDLYMPVEQAIQHTSVSVMITDSQDNVMFTNAAIYNLFETHNQHADINPQLLIKQLLHKQFPESAGVFSKRRTWTGELYWHYPPTFHKWIQTSISPVLNNNQHVTHWIYTISDNTRMKYLVESNENLALYDSLTKLPNRQYFWQTIEQKIKHSEHFYLLYVDLHKFKRINERYGHSTGDDFLIQTSSRLKSVIDDGDFLARIGADEFAILHRCEKSESLVITQDSCKLLANRIYNAFKQPFYTSNNETYYLSVCMGIAHYPIHALQPESLLKASDMALDVSRLPNNQAIQFYSARMRKAVEAKLVLENQLKKAIEEETFQIYLQPIFDLETEEIVKAEALLRWHPSEGESITPDTFIPLAEQSGLIVPLGQWVIRKVCEILTEFKERNLDIKLSINLSAKQVSDRYLFEFIETTVSKLGVDARQLELELTEGVLVDDYEKASLLLTALRKMGISISIDDFGTGYSSLSYLKHLPIDHLKIDRSFVFDLDTDKDDRAIVMAILAMAKQLQLSVIAEGVETQAQRDFLKLNQCTSAQGFYYSKPIPLDEFYLFLQQHNKKALDG